MKRDDLISFLFVGFLLILVLVLIFLFELRATNKHSEFICDEKYNVEYVIYKTNIGVAITHRVDDNGNIVKCDKK